jgi:PAS domain S-box-containing protein
LLIAALHSYLLPNPYSLIMLTNNRTVLIINDSPIERTTYRDYLQQEASFTYTVWEAESTAAALQLCSQQLPDGILLDYLIGDRDGLEFLIELKTDTGEKCPPVIMLNDRGYEAIAVRAFKAGVEDYLLKNEITPDNLRYVTRTAIENFQLRQKLRHSEEKFRTSIENMLDCFGIFTAMRDENTGAISDFRVDYFNAAALASNGMTTDAIGQPLCKLLPAHCESGLFAEYCRVVETGEPLIKDCLIYSDYFGDRYLTRAYDIQVSKLDDGFVASWRDITEQKQSEEANLRNEERLQLAIQIAKLGYWQLELTDYRLLGSEQGKANFGLSPAENLTYQQLLELIHPEDRDRVIETMIGAIENRRDYATEYRIILSDGSIRWIAVRGNCFYDENGSPLRMVGVTTDITERKQTELSLQEREQRYRAIFDTTFQFMGLLTPEGILIEANQTALDFGGLTREEVLNCPFWETRWWAISTETQARLQSAIARAARGEFIRYEVEVLGAGNSTATVDFSLKPIYDDSGQVVLLIPEGRDISDLIKIQTELNESQTRLNLALQSAKMGFWDLNLLDKKAFWSKQSKQLLGLPEDWLEMSYQVFLTRVHPEDRQMLNRAVELSIELGFQEVEFRVVWNDGSIHWLTDKGQVFYNEAGQAVRMLGICTDITEQKNAEIALQQANQRFELATTAINSIIYDWDLAANAVERTRGVLEVIGYLPEEIENTPQWWLNLIHPDDRPRKSPAEFLAEITNSDRCKTEYRVLHKQGHYIWVEDSCLAIKNEAGQPIRIVGSTRNISSRKQTEASLRCSEAFNRQILETIPDCIKVLALEGQILYMNSVGQQLLDLNEESYRNVNWIDCWSEGDRQKLERAMASAIAGQIGKIQGFCLTRNSNSKWWEAIIAPIFDANGQVERLLSVSRDISDSKKLEVILEQQLAQLEAIYATAPIGLCFLDTERRYVQMNGRLAEINGLSVAEHIGKTIGEILPELAERQEPIFQQVLQTGRPILNLEVRGTTPAQPGVERYWLASYYPLAVAGELLGINITVQEIAERKQAEVALCESEQRLQAIVNNSKAAIFMKDIQGRYLLVNSECERLFKVTKNWIQGKTDYDIFSQEIAANLQLNDRQVLDTGSALTLEEAIPLADGIHTYIAVKFPLFDADGLPYAICGISTDISDRVQFQGERERLLAEAETARAAAEAANRSKDEFVAIVAHELRSPINSVAGWAQMLQMQKSNEALLDRALEAIKRGTQTQVKLIEDLLDISRIACGTLRLTFAPLNLTTVIQAAMSLVRPMAEEKQIFLATQLVAIAQISGDLNRLQQIIVNLLTNAIKFTPEGGRIEIELEVERKAALKGNKGNREQGAGEQPTSNQSISNQQLVQKYAKITIGDNGKGISPEFLPRIFEQFRQGQNDSDSKSGLGLGLAIVKNLVELHNGTISAESMGLEQGATFTVWLPLLESEPVVSISEPAIAISASPLAGIPILAVDDEPDSLELLRFILENAGAEVQTATSGKAALELIPQFNPRFLVSDIAMPDLNGHQLLQQIKTLYPQRQIFAIALTAYASSSDRDYALRMGFEQYFSKPIEPEVLVAAIVSLIKD